MKSFCLILLFLVVASCGTDKSVESTVPNDTDTGQILKDKVEPKKDSTRPINLDSFLANPFDLVAFKAKKNGSHSSGAYFKDYHFKPSGRGRSWSFFGFSPRKPNSVNRNGDSIRAEKAGYIWRSHGRQMPTGSERGLILNTFQPDNKYQNQYANPTETLIEAIGEFNDYDLPELAFIGLKRKEITAKLGEPSFTKNDCWVYTSGINALILKMSDAVEALRFVRLSEQ